MLINYCFVKKGGYMQYYVQYDPSYGLKKYTK